MKGSKIGGKRYDAYEGQCEICNPPFPSKIDGKNKPFKKGKKFKVKGGFKMKKLSFALVGFVLLAFLFSFTMNTPLLAQEKEEEVEDVMDMALEDLLNVEITTAGKQAEKISDVPASVVVYTRADIERYGYMSLDEILENVPGIYPMDQRSLAGKTFGVRGFWTAFANSTILLVNGVRMERLGTDGAVYPGLTVPVEAIDRIEVIRGPMSVIYGAGAFYGVINVITNDVSGDKPGQLAVSYGMEKTTRIAVRTAGKNDDFIYALNFGYYDTAGPDLTFSDMSTVDVSEFSPHTSSDGLFDVDAKFFNLFGSYKGFYASATFDLDSRGHMVYFPPASSGVEQHRTYTAVSFGYNGELSEKFSVDAKMTYHKGSIKTDWDWLTPPGGVNLGGDYNFRDDFELELNTYYRPNEKLNITFGLFYKKIIKEQLQAFIPIIEQVYRIGMYDPIETRAAFLQANWAPSKKLRIVLGARFEQVGEYSVYHIANPYGSGQVKAEGTFTHDTFEFIPRAAVIFSLNDKNFIKFFYGKAINVPTFYHTGGQAAAGQPGLAPEFIQTFELNYLAALSDKLTLNASLFYNDLDNLITQVPYVDEETGAWIGVAENAGKMTTTGVELSIKSKLSDKFRLELSGIYQKTKDKRPGLEDVTVAYAPEFLAYLKASYAFSKKANFAVTGRYVGGMEAFYDVLGAARIGQGVDGYFSLSAYLRFNDLFSKGWFLGIKCANLLDELYRYPTFTLQSDLVGNTGLIGDGRMFIVTIGKKF